MSLLQKASIVTTPTAYGVGVLNSIKPAQSFSEELVVNGNFATGITGWSSGASASLSWDSSLLGISNNSTSYNSYVYQEFILVAGTTYIFTADIVADSQGSGGSKRIWVTETASDSTILGQTSTTGIGSYSVKFTATGATRIRLGKGSNSGTTVFNNVSLKQQTDADFDFTRNSSATRVNPDYLIQDVSILSSNLVQNGNFSELGSELVTNGNFETDSNWVKGTGWTISGGKAICDGSQSSQSNFVQAGIVPINKTYKATFTVVVTSGSIVLGIGGSNAQPTVSSSGTYTFTSKATQGDSNLYFSALTNFIGSIDNVSVKQVDPNDNWVLGTGWSFETNEAIKVAGVNSEIVQIGAFTSGFATKKFIVKFSIIVNSGAIRLRAGTNNQPYLNVSGDYSYTLTPTGNDQLKFQADNTFNGSITDISVIEVQQTDIPRLDYTNGTASILLEPQSTNLMPYSSDFSQWTPDTNASVTSNSIISPDGTQNADKLVAGSSVARQSIKFNLTASGNISAYVFAKKGEYSVIQLTDAVLGAAFANFDLESGLVGSTNTYAANIENYGNGWYRCGITYANNNSINSIRLSIAQNSTSARLVNFAGNSSDGLYIYGAQLENSLFPTSYIPTSGSTVTRAAETLNNAGLTNYIGQTEGNFVFRF